MQVQYPSSEFFVVMCGGASANVAAARFLKEIVYPDLCDVVYMSHSLDNVGKRFHIRLRDSILCS